MANSDSCAVALLLTALFVAFRKVNLEFLNNFMAVFVQMHCEYLRNVYSCKKCLLALQMNSSTEIAYYFFYSKLVYKRKGIISIRQTLKNY